jgi:hypothetical protein
MAILKRRMGGIRRCSGGAAFGRRALAGAVCLAVAGSLGGCRRADDKPKEATAAAAAATAPLSPGCDTVGRVNVGALSALPEVSRVVSAWLQGGSSDLAAAFQDDGINPLDGMEAAWICQTPRRSPSGGRELAVTLSGDAAPGLFARLATPKQPGRKVTHERWGASDVLVGERAWVALRDRDLVMATTPDVLRRVLADPSDVVRPAGNGLLSLTFSGPALAEVLSGGQPFRAAPLNAVKTLFVELPASADSLTVRLATSDRAAADSLRTALQKFLDTLPGGMKRDGQAPVMASRVEGTDVFVAASFSRHVMDGLAQTLAMRLGARRPRARAR